MKITPTRLPDLLIIEPRVVEDDRGWLAEMYQCERFAQHGLPREFRQDNRSHSRRGVLRGLHYQLRRPQGKLVSCIRGRIFDVAVDARRGSPTFGQWVGVELSEERALQLWVPPGFAHGFCALSDPVDVYYKCTDVYVPADERGVLWSDPAIGIEWPLAQPIVSPRDQAFPPLSQADLPEYTAPAPR